MTINLKSISAFSESRDNLLTEPVKSNEDCLLPPQKINNGYIFCIADGVGSYPGAKYASRFACDYVRDQKNIDHNYLKEMFSNDIQKNFKKYILNCDNRYSKASTTLTVCYLNEDGLSIWHAGDCRVYIRKENKLCQITKDHTQYQRLIDLKIYTKKELKEKNISKSTLTTALSAFIELKEDYHFIPIGVLRSSYGENFSILAMTDGAHHFWELNKRFSTPTMLDTIKFSNALKRRIERRGPIDDYTLLSMSFDIKSNTTDEFKHEESILTD